MPLFLIYKIQVKYCIISIIYLILSLNNSLTFYLIKMNTNKFLIGSLIGGIVAFMCGGVLYAVVFKDILANACPGLAAQQTKGDMIALAIGNLATGTVLAYIFEKWANIRTWLAGGMAGATIGSMMAISFDSMMQGTTNLMSWGGVAIDTVISAILWGITGAAIGWWLGFKRA